MTLLPVKQTVADRIPVTKAAKRFLDDRRRANVSAQTLHWYEQKLSQLQRVVAAEHVDDLTRDRLEAFLDGLEAKGRNRDYIRGWHQVLRTFVRYCREEGWATAPDLVRPNAIGTKWFSIQKPKATESPVAAYDDEQVARIIEAAETPRNRAMVKLYVNTGIRRSELANLRLDDLDFENRKIRVLGKGRRYRVVAMSEGARIALLNYMNRERKHAKTEHLFIARGGHPLTVSAISAIFQRIKQRVGFRAHPHALRHTFATNYLRDVGSASLLQQNLGHTDPKMTQRYVSWVGVDLSQGMERMRQF